MKYFWMTLRRSNIKLGAASANGIGVLALTLMVIVSIVWG